MTNSKKTELRKKAEKILREKGLKNESFYQESLETLIEELNIYQIELEHQNDELKQTQSSLEKTNAKYSDLYHHAPVGYFTIDENYRIINCNNKGEELLSKNKKQLLHSKFTDYVHPDFQDVYYQHHRIVLSEKKDSSCEIKLISKSNQEYFVQLNSIPTTLFDSDKPAMRTAVTDITERKRIEHDNLNQLNILKNISDSVIVTDLNGEITFWNRGAEEIFGYTQQEMLGKSPALLYPDMDISKLNYDLEKIKAGEDYVGEWKGLNKNKQLVWVNIRTSVLCDIQDKPIGFLGVAKNITERKKQELFKLQLAAIVEFSNDGIESMDLDGNVLSWNKGAEIIYGYKASEMIGKNVLVLFPDEIKHELKKNIENVKKGKAIANMESRRRRKNGEMIDVSITYSPLKNDAGDIVGVSIITRDITQQISNQRALKESELKYQTIYEDSGDGILLLKKDGILDCNSQACRMLGYEKEELIGKSPMDFSPSRQDDGALSDELGMQYFEKALKKGYNTFNWQHQSKNGKILNVRVSLKRIEINGEKVLLALMHDLTDVFTYQKKLKEKNEEILAQNEEYQALNEELHEANQRLRMVNKQIELSENKFKTAFKTSPDAVNINRMSDGLYMEINDGFTQLTGFTEDDVKGKTSADIDIWVYPEDRLKLFNGLKEKGYVQNLDTRFRRKDGSVLDGLMSASIIEIENEKYILSITRDITERKRLQNELEVKEQKYRQLVEETYAISWEYDIVQDKWTYVSPQSISILNYEPQEWTNLEFWTQNLHPDEKEWAFKYCMECTVKGENHTLEYRFKAKDGKYVWLRDVVSVEMKDGNPVILRGLMIDISETKEAQIELRHQREYLRTIIQTNIDGFWIVNKDRYFSDVNDAYLSMSGYTREEFLKLKISDVEVIESEEETTQRIKEISKNGYASFVTKHKRKDGTIFDVEVSVTFLDFDGGQMICFCRDITEKILHWEKVQKDEKRQSSILKLMQKSPVKNIQEFLDMALNEAIEITESKIGYIYYYNEEKEQFILNSLPKEVMEECLVTNPQTCYELDKTGIWGEAVRQRKAITINDYKAKNSLKKGYPAGHVELEKFMTVPVFQDNKIVAVVGVANKSVDYNKSDELQLNLLMDSVWKTVNAKSAQNELIESEKKYRRLAENISDVIWTSGLDFKLDYVSTSITRLTGDSVEDHLKKPIEKKIPKEYLDKIKGILQEELEKEVHLQADKNRSVLFETPFFKTDGSTIWVTMNVSFIRDENGNIAGLQGVTHDITKRKRVEQEIANMASMLDLAPSAITIHDMDGNFLYSNKKNLEWHGYAYDEFMNINLHELDVPDSLALIDERIEKIVKEGEAFFDVEHFRKDGTTFPMMMYVKTIDWKGAPALLSIGTDISERKAAEEALEHSHNLLKYIIEHNRSAVAVHDRHLNYIYVSQPYIDEYDINGQDVIGKNHYELFPNLPQKWRDAHKKALKGEVVKADNDPFYNKDGSIEWTRWECRPWYEANGAIGGIIVYTEKITKQKELEESLKNSLRRNKAILEANPDLMFVFSEQGEIVDFKADNTGDLYLNPEEFLGKNINQILPKPLAVLTFEKINEVKISGKIAEYSYSLKIGGRDKFYESRLVPYGERQYLAIVRDITQAKLDEIKIRESGQKLKDAMRTAKLGSWEYDLVDDKLYWSEETIEIFGFDPNKVEITYDLFMDHVHEDDKKWVDRAYKDSLIDKLPYEIKHRIITKRGQIKYVKEKCRTVFDDEGKPLKSFGIIQDITDLKNIELDLIKAKEKVEESEQKFRMLAEHSTDVIWLRTDEKMIYINPAFETVFGIPCEEIYENAQVFTDIIHPDDKSLVLNQFQSEEFKQKGIFNCDYRIVRRDNKIRWINARASAIYDESGKVIKRIGTATDITLRKEMELELQKAKEKAEESDRLKSAFLANMSHEIRTPMNAILGFSELLREKQFSFEKQSHFLSIISSRSKDLLRIINDIIDISKIEANQLIIVESGFGLNKMMIELYHQFNADLKTEGKQNLQLEFIPGLEGAHSYIKCDENRLKQVLVNIIYNAIKFTDTGKIIFGYTLKEKQIEFYVKDSGIGIPKEVHSLIFERFRQADDSTTRKYGGTGLGLPICKQILKLMGGEIWVDSEPGKGSTFYFTIPYKTIELEADLPQNGLVIKKGSWKDKTILIVEDDPLSCMYLTEILKPGQLNILQTNNGNEVMDLVNKTKKIDLILLDINLPGKNGFELVKELKEKYPAIKIIAQSAYSMKDEIDKGLELGFDDYLTKPIDSNVLISIINKYLK